ncbi:gamma-glutamyltransferase family protein [Zavarzinia sp. CC-PAN008]|uniref:gamma-glutamyltransferase family protein n=1 Tax=Zavarzinia sp. CC-PAN008 TaxID=3243332 RepID=UPI003F74510D
MNTNLSRSRSVTKAGVEGSGVVAAQNQEAADVGAAILDAGGNAVDAAIATAMAIGVLEPWMSGIGGGGFMQVHHAPSGTSAVIAYGMKAAGGLDPADYPVVGEAEGWFGWPRVKDDRNAEGPFSIAVPGAVAGFAHALRRFGTMPWADLVRPAARLAERGLLLDWYAALRILVDAASLRRDPACAGMFLPGGLPAVPADAGLAAYLPNPALARSLDRLATAGPEDFYSGELASLIAEELGQAGSAITARDLADYQAIESAPLRLERSGATLLAPDGLNAGPTMARTLELAPAMSGPHTPEGEARLAAALMQAYEERLAGMGEGQESAGRRDGHTTHLSVIDRDGTMVSLTNTLLNTFGARVMLPRSGILMNDGMYWFDPRPGRANSIAPGRRPLSNMCPILALKDGAPWFALGASGGRKIMPAVLQIALSVIDHGLDFEAAFQRPRFDASGTAPILVDRAADPAVVAAIRAVEDVRMVDRQPYPGLFACPVGVLRRSDGRVVGLTEPSLPWPGATASQR